MNKRGVDIAFQLPTFSAITSKCPVYRVRPILEESDIYKDAGRTSEHHRVCRLARRVRQPADGLTKGDGGYRLHIRVSKSGINQSELTSTFRYQGPPSSFLITANMGMREPRNHTLSRIQFNLYNIHTGAAGTSMDHWSPGLHCITTYRGSEMCMCVKYQNMMRGCVYSN